MALRDVKEYYFKMLSQYLEMKADLADFEQALKDGFITEDQLQAAFEEVNKVQQNYERLSYIMYLLGSFLSINLQIYACFYSGAYN